MAGAGSRFSSAGYLDPKPLIRIKNIPMIRIVIENLRPNIPHRFIFICQKQHVIAFDLLDKLKVWGGNNSEIVELDGLTEGAACTVLAASHLIDNDHPLMIANCDQYIDVDINDYLNDISKYNLDGLIMTMNANDPKWSFVSINDDRLVTRVVEKQVISNEATVGIYNFKTGAEFISGAGRMISDNERVNGEFYVAPVYNQIIKQGKRVGIYNIGSEGHGMFGLGIPYDLEKFLSLPILDKACKRCI